jgi:glycosyltransferase involved in cell wall biosynthesis
VSDFRVSIVMPVYNGEKYITESVENVFSQSYSDFELIVVDDGSTDTTPEICRSFGNRIKYIRQQNSGPAAARNTGILASSCSLISFIDVDDVWPQQKLEKQVAMFRNNSACEMVMGLVQRMVLDKNTGEFHNDAIEPILSFNLGAMLVKRTVFDKVGMFDASMRYSEDVDWLSKVRENSIELEIQFETALYYRIHDTNMTRSKAINDRFFLQAIKKSLERRRQNNTAFKPIKYRPE